MLEHIVLLINSIFYFYTDAQLGEVLLPEEYDGNQDVDRLMRLRVLINFFRKNDLIISIYY